MILRSILRWIQKCIFKDLDQYRNSSKYQSFEDSISWIYVNIDPKILNFRNNTKYVFKKKKDFLEHF